MRICASVAKARHGVNDAELATLECKLARNPCYRNAAQMRLYVESEVRQLAEAKRERAQYALDHADEIAAERAAARKAARIQVVAAARAHMAATAEAAPVEDLPIVRASVALPQQVLEMIMGHLGRTALALGGPSAAARDVARAACACPDLRAAVTAGYVAIAPPRDAFDTTLMDMLGAPMRHTVAQLRDASWALGIRTSGTKAELAVRILQHHGVDAPTRAPSALLLQLREEREARSSEVFMRVATEARVAAHVAERACARAVEGDEFKVGRLPASARGLRLALYDAGFDAACLRDACKQELAIIKEEDRAYALKCKERLDRDIAAGLVCPGCRQNVPAGKCPRRMCASCCMPDTSGCTGHHRKHATQVQPKCAVCKVNTAASRCTHGQCRKCCKPASGCLAH